MKRKCLGDGTGHDEENGTNGTCDKHVSTKFGPGDVIWIKLSGSSWWPTQIMDEDCVINSMKPQKKGSDDLLVRLYGTYKYSYVDPVASLLEFDNVLKRHKGSHKEIIEEALRQDFKTKEQTAKKKGKSVSQDELKKKNKLNGTNNDVTPVKESLRKLKVMQGLGLIAPSGSPYRKNGQTLNLVQ